MMAYRKKNKGNTRNFKKIVTDTLRELICDVSICVYENGKILIYMLQIFFFILFRGLSYYVDLSVCALLFTSSLFVTEYLFRLLSNVKHVSEDGIPIPPERYTKTTEEGFVQVEKIEEAVVYLCDVEDYLKRKGLLKDDTAM